MTAARVSLATVIGWGLLLLPLLTMAHEIGGHAAACVALGGQVREIGAFYVDCSAPDRRAAVLVALAGVAVDGVLAVLGFLAWRASRRPLARLGWWYVWVAKAFVAAGYFCFSGATGVGDLGPGVGGGIGPLAAPGLWRVGELLIGVPVYGLLVAAAIRTLAGMLGPDLGGQVDRRRVALGFYLTCGAVAVAVGLMNPVGVFVTIFSAAASSFGGLAGLISAGLSGPPRKAGEAFAVPRSLPLLALGAAATLAFAIVLGRSLRF